MGGQTLTVRSRDPNSAKAVASTIIKGQFDGPVVTFSSRQATGCVLEGLTVQGSTVGLSCQDAIPTIRDCVLNCPDGIAVEFWWGCKPRLIGCTVAGQVKEGGDPGLIAYWTLDETEGATAHDSVGTNDARVVGNPVWRPSGGKVKGALQLDGVGEYLTTGYVLDPGTGSFTVLAWVKGGAPGQVILSQDGGANWLLADASRTDSRRTCRRLRARIRRSHWSQGPSLPTGSGIASVLPGTARAESCTWMTVRWPETRKPASRHRPAVYTSGLGRTLLPAPSGRV